MLKKAHLRRYGALGRTLEPGEPQPKARRANPEIPASVSEPERLRLACDRRAPPRIWTFLSILEFFRILIGRPLRPLHEEDAE
jgi:hypothetical protein